MTSLIAQCQCDQMARLLFNIWPFATLKNCPKVKKGDKVNSKFNQILSRICQRQFKMLTKVEEVVDLFILLSKMRVTR